MNGGRIDNDTGLPKPGCGHSYDSSPAVKPGVGWVNRRQGVSRKISTLPSDKDKKVVLSDEGGFLYRPDALS